MRTEGRDVVWKNVILIVVPLVLICELSLFEKLRDVQQEREGTSLNYFKVIFNYIKQFFCSILFYLGLSQSILDYFGLSRCILV